MAIALAVLAAFLFGLGLVTSRVGLRELDARAGAAISIPVATILFAAAAPFAIDFAAVDLRAVAAFAILGVFFPALVTLLTFRATEELGPTVTGTISSASPLFALAGAALFLGERIPPQAAVAALGVAGGIALLSWTPRGVRAHFPARALVWPVAGALVRGLSQVGAKAGLALWPNPFAASLVAYAMSSLTVIGADRLRRGPRARPTWRALAWFVLTGAVNGGAVLTLYAALTAAPVSIVAPIVATYPLMTAVLSALLLRGERPGPRMLAGAALTVAAVAYLVAAVR
jgi:drug/metabolite transporter (DMT)-like permease